MIVKLHFHLIRKSTCVPDVDKWSQQMADTKDLPSISCNLVSSNKLESEDAISQVNIYSLGG